MGLFIGCEIGDVKTQLMNLHVTVQDFIAIDRVNGLIVF